MRCLASPDGKTIRRAWRSPKPLVRDGGEQQLTDELLGVVVEAVKMDLTHAPVTAPAAAAAGQRRPHRPAVQAAQARLDANHEAELRHLVAVDLLVIDTVASSRRRDGVLGPFPSLLDIERVSQTKDPPLQKTGKVRPALGEEGWSRFSQIFACELSQGVGLLLRTLTPLTREVE